MGMDTWECWVPTCEVTVRQRAGNTVDAACRSIEEHCSSEAC